MFPYPWANQMWTLVSFLPPLFSYPTVSPRSVLRLASLPSGIQVSEIGLIIQILDNSSNIVAEIDAPLGPATTNGSSIESSISKAPLSIKDANGFGEILSEALAESSATLTTKGFATVVINSSGSKSTIGPVPFAHSFAFPGTLSGPADWWLGLSGFSDSQPQIGQISVTGSDSSGIYITSNAVMTNTGSLTVSFGTVSMEVKYGSERIGTIEFPNFSIAPGQNTLPTTFYFSPTDPAVGTDVLSTLIAGQSVPVQILGTSNSTAIPALQHAMSLVSLSATLPAL
jgi:hypothetical protein